MIVDVEFCTPVVLDKKEFGEGEIDAVYLCKPVTNIWCQGYTQSVSPGCEQLNIRLNIICSFRYSHRCILISLKNCSTYVLW